ncbi:MAG: RING finger and CHY zinc finger domain-containing protein 1 isoform X1 [Hyperionvirus sp.]|uniref:RING finger and CHY zinc finger domain-containing protein 1 isoform X1 n=1 Tax=Hyperionvirus sp. TaxID=2487770 RepID=A0A3G5AAL1_9VIRU|nr:MAG: RING finger and CHY zinc finger domain-containing protein 1 isoform X1 [Hyperionvirus sp.]
MNDSEDIYDDDNLGCDHYGANCFVVSLCCGGIHPCKRCHDEENDHTIKKENIEEIICQNCFEQQAIAPICSKCHLIFAKYYCAICKIFDNFHDPDEIFHCDKCNVCLCLDQLFGSIFHCDKCGCCLSVGLKNNHKCREDRMQDNCCICLEPLLNKSARLSNCGHIIHRECFDVLVRTSDKCPLCGSVIIEAELVYPVRI